VQNESTEFCNKKSAELHGIKKGLPAPKIPSTVKVVKNKGSSPKDVLAPVMKVC